MDDFGVVDGNWFGCLVVGRWGDFGGIAFEAVDSCQCLDYSEWVRNHHLKANKKLVSVGNLNLHPSQADHKLECSRIN